MSKKKRKKRTLGARRFDGRRYSYSRTFASKAEARRFARVHRNTAQTARARIVKASSPRRYRVYTNPCGHSRWYYIHRGKGSNLRAQKAYEKGYEEYARNQR